MVLIGLMLACAPKSPPLSAATPTPLDLVLVAEVPGEPAPRDVPAHVASRIGELATVRNLVPKQVPASAWSSAFASRETAGQRVGWALEQPGSSGATLVVSVMPTYFGFVAGRYRWTVAVESTLRAGDSPEQSERVEVPVLLTWDHEREDAAIIAALPLIEREIADQLDRWLGAAQEHASQ